MEYKIIDFIADKVKHYKADREAMNAASLEISFLSFLCKYVFLAESYVATDKFRFSSIIL